MNHDVTMIRSALPPPCTDTTTTKTLTVSAPGKVLIVGGYLIVVDDDNKSRKNSGLVIAVDKRFYSKCSITYYDTSTNGNNNSNYSDNDSNINNSNNATTTTNSNIILIHVSSPQLDNSQWEYQYTIDTCTLIAATADANANPFLEKTIRLSLLYLVSCCQQNNTIHSIRLTVQGDNDFYSILQQLQQRHMELTLEHALSLPPFLPAIRCTSDNDSRYYKTGLGSSACLVTSIVAALTYSLRGASTRKQHRKDDDNPTNSTLNTIYNLAQLCHCYAQGKIGSGFDISAACYGSHTYQRFSQDRLLNLVHLLSQEQENTRHGKDEKVTMRPTTLTNIETIKQLLQQTIESKWDGGIVQHLDPSIPTAPSSCKNTSFIQLIMADVCHGGSESPSMAKKVLQWRNNVIEQQQHDLNNNNKIKVPHWDDLVDLNQEIIDIYENINDTVSLLSDEHLQIVKDLLLTTKSCEWDTLSEKILIDNTTTNDDSNNTLQQEKDIERMKTIPKLLFKLYSQFQLVRYHLKEMGNVCNVPIEPDCQTRLANATQESLNGVICALVPGAGGYDAIVCLYIHDDMVRSNIANFWSSYDSHVQQPEKSNNNKSDTGVNNDSLTTASITTTIMKVCPLTCRGVEYGNGIVIEENNYDYDE